MTAIRTLPLLFLAPALGFSLASTAAHADMLQNVTGEECVRGDCVSGNGTLEFTTPWGKGRYVGEFLGGEFHGYGRLEVPISYLEEEVYVGNWANGRRNGRGKHWNGTGNLYIGQWRDDKRHGHGSYFVNLPEWVENRHTEFWLRENTENYTGEFVDGHYHGQGTYRWPDGQKYVGGFFASDKHGRGTFYYATGTARPQNWEHGDLIR
ncbi:MAG: hypothetical protein WD396_03570 [Pseudohongiellaceae bacterium]